MEQSPGFTTVTLDVGDLAASLRGDVAPAAGEPTPAKLTGCAQSGKGKFASHA
jgi:hypothetical protein